MYADTSDSKAICKSVLLHFDPVQTRPWSLLQIEVSSGSAFDVFIDAFGGVT